MRVHPRGGGRIWPWKAVRGKRSPCYWDSARWFAAVADHVLLCDPTWDVLGNVAYAL